MFERRDIKENAKLFLEGRYFKLIIIVFIFLFFTTTVSTTEVEKMFGYEKFYGEDVGDMMEQRDEANKTKVDKLLEKTPLSSKFNLEYITADILVRPLKNLDINSFNFRALVPVCISILITIIYLPISILIQVGFMNIFISDKKTNDINIKDIFLFFKGDDWWNIIKVVLLTNLHILGGLLLFIVPGIIMSIEYSLVQYILAEDRDIEAKEAMELSSKMTDGYKWDIVKLDISLIGWYLIIFFFGHLGSLVVMPYIYAVKGELYIELKERYKTLQADEVNNEIEIEMGNI